MAMSRATAIRMHTFTRNVSQARTRCMNSGSTGVRGPARSSIASAASRQISSRKRAPTSCTPTGIPFESPVGTEMHGRPRTVGARRGRRHKIFAPFPSLSARHPIPARKRGLTASRHEQAGSLKKNLPSTQEPGAAPQCRQILRKIDWGRPSDISARFCGLRRAMSFDLRDHSQIFDSFSTKSTSGARPATRRCCALYGVACVLEPLGGLRDCVSDACVKLRVTIHDRSTDWSFEGEPTSGAGTHHGSRTSPWAMAASATLKSLTERASRPCTAISCAVIGRSPVVALYTGTPRSARSPVIPQHSAGCRMSRENRRLAQAVPCRRDRSSAAAVEPPPYEPGSMD